MPVPWRRLLSIATLSAPLLLAFVSARPPIAAARPAANTDTLSGDPPLIDLDGYKQAVARYRGKGVLVTFWATWCQPCRDEFPMIVALAKEYGPQGLVVIGVSLDEDSDMGLVRRFLSDSHPGFPNFRQKPGIDADAFYQGVNPEWRGTMPQNDFYARDGHLARFFVGQKQKSAFEDAIRFILLVPSSENRSTKPVYAGN
ncbi:MAG TPA: TlpA disulfide reductase family protein [Candidatus Acidoferrales bacterium]|nr:TlpA disulfide reductase family protein [Candidatus Acidoferrales bacterium]